MTFNIVRAEPADAHEIAYLIATAFHTLDVSAWLVSDPEERQRVLYADFRIFVDYAIDFGDVLLSHDREGTAVWPPRSTPLPPIPRYHRRLVHACRSHVDRFNALDAEFDKHRPTDPHHHLVFLAVHPAKQRQGTGSRLLAAHHERLDRAGLPAYLEASSQRSRHLYARHGYVDRGQPIHLPDGGPRLWPMWREPRLATPLPEHHEPTAANYTERAERPVTPSGRRSVIPSPR